MPVDLARATHCSALKWRGIKIVRHLAVFRYRYVEPLHDPLGLGADWDLLALPIAREIGIRTPVYEHSELVVLEPLDALFICDLVLSRIALSAKRYGDYRDIKQTAIVYGKASCCMGLPGGEHRAPVYPDDLSPSARLLFRATNITG